MRTRHFFALLLLTGLMKEGQAQSSQPYRISTNVNLMVLHPIVRDRKGQFVSNLRQQDFEVYEDGVRQSIQMFDHEDVPVTVGLVIDHSGSMRHKLPEVIAAARTFINSSSPRDEMFVVNFNDSVTLGLPESIRFSDRPDQLARAISNTPAAGETALYDAVIAALGEVQAGAPEQKVLVVISDGGDNASAHSLREALQRAGTSSASIYTIGIFEEDDPDRNPDVLRHLAKATGGEAYFPTRLDEVVAVCERIARDIRHQYTVGYAPTRTAETSAFRSIRVTAEESGRGKLLVRARSGYIAAK
jgi:Ca-activated chloride channel homolog